MSNKQLLELCKKAKDIAAAHRKYLSEEAETFCRAMADEYLAVAPRRRDRVTPEGRKRSEEFNERLDEWAYERDDSREYTNLIRITFINHVVENTIYDE